MEPALAVAGVRKTFGSTVAVDAMDLVVPRGALYGFIGPNGAGKTTCIRMIMSILFPDSGTLSVLGRRSALEAKDRIGYLPEERGVYRKMRVSAFLVYMGQLKSLDARTSATRAQDLLTRVGLPDIWSRRCEELSKGMLQRVQLVAALLHEPDLLILDEPFSGLDPVSVRVLRDVVLAEHRRGATVLFSTHVMTQAEDLCQHVVMIHRGRKVLDEPMAGLRRRYDPTTIVFEPRDPNADAAELSALPGISAVVRGDSVYRISLADGVDSADCMARIAGVIPPARLDLARLTLEDEFIRIVSEGSAPADRARMRRELADDEAVES